MPGTILSTLYHFYEVGTIIVPIKKKNTENWEVEKFFTGHTAISGWSRTRASLMAQIVKNLPAMQKTGVQSLGREDPLEKGMATHSSILAW